MRVILWGMEGGREGDWLLHSETDHADLNAVWWVDGVWHGDRWIEGTIIGTWVNIRERHGQTWRQDSREAPLCLVKYVLIESGGETRGRNTRQTLKVFQATQSTNTAVISHKQVSVSLSLTRHHYHNQITQGEEFEHEILCIIDHFLACFFPIWLFHLISSHLMLRYMWSEVKIKYKKMSF